MTSVQIEPFQDFSELIDYRVDLASVRRNVLPTIGGRNGWGGHQFYRLTPRWEAATAQRGAPTQLARLLGGRGGPEDCHLGDHQG